LNYELIRTFLKTIRKLHHFQIILEAIAATFGILSVYFSIKKIFGFIQLVLFLLLICLYSFCFGLLGDCMINVYYTIMSIYGWILWSKSSEDNIHVEVSWANKKDWLFSFFIRSKFRFSKCYLLLQTIHRQSISNDF
jgi:nicotinamide mononucleotide transporter